MSGSSVLLNWGTVPYWIALGVALTFALLQISGLLGAFASDADADADGPDLDADVDADVDTDIDADADAEAGDADADADAESETGFLQTLAASLGIGKVPFSIVWQCFAISFGFSGIVASYLLARFQLGLLTLAISFPLATIVAYFLTRKLTRSLVKVLSARTQEATSRAELIGQVGVVISSRVDQEFGEVRLCDRSGHVVRLVCRSSGRTIPEGAEVIVVEADAERPVVDALDDAAFRH